MSRWYPTGAIRGTIAVLAGRGETPALYERFGRRLAADGYAVVLPDPDSDPADWFEPGAARFLAGTDTGALRAWQLAPHAEPDGLILVGTPLAAGRPPADRAEEIGLRTSCPVHRELLRNDPGFRWGQLTDVVPEPPEHLPEVPTLLLHGNADAIAPVAPVAALAALLPQSSLAVFEEGVHDVLNDQHHRSAAARIVLFCEEIAKGAVLLPEVHKPRRSAPVQVSARVDYSLRALRELAGRAGPVKCAVIAREQRIPLNSLVNLMIELRRAGLVSSRRGCDGGYWLARGAEQITIGEVVRAVGGGVTSVHSGSPDAGVWRELDRRVADFLGQVPVVAGPVNEEGRR
ncbi:transcriptional regulator, BadM/Rrf2 family [Saccharopolyspora kobensis]|uniref:Transcriptional regulator, BadM/Rrf2 family n=1 Tax=Saccharopolyspora kobensis TaxID=146035 RepID=A0A1H5UCJ1_9PSEU|nr:Rrf2 family transcriptional regulator [Saccharopolyspora kobensis]SEF71957.1 transcriptional regulator, BadM/Rrf2 family [Saccharopolyspora kobensis]SFC75551.1 transcriptional regulator, BadM/Rrf2 family [Saccharopolyspora kobensis]